MVWTQMTIGVLLLCFLLFSGCTPSSGSTNLATSPTVESQPNSSGDPGAVTPVAGVSENCTDSRTGFADHDIIEQVCKLVNQERAALGEAPLKLDVALSNVSQAFSEDMVQRNYFSHIAPDGMGPADRLKAGHISYQTWGENIAYYYKTPADVMRAWMNSAGHKANILNKKFGKIGIGWYQNYWVQDFTN
jgi:uncharacterized protein YkwD